MMRFLRKGDRYVLNKPHQKYSDPSFYGFKCLIQSFLGKFYYQFSCNVQESRASGATGYAARLMAVLAHAIQVLRTVYARKRSIVDTCLTHERNNNHTCLTHEPHMNDTTNCVKDGGDDERKRLRQGVRSDHGKGNEQAVSKLALSMASVLRFNTLLIHCYYFTHTWLILRPYTKSASSGAASWFGIASRLELTLVHTCSTVVRVLFECCSSATRTTLEAHPKSTRSRVEQVSNTTRSRVEGQSKPTRRIVEQVPNNSRSRVEELANRLSRFAGNDGKVLNDLYMNRLILRWFHLVCEEVRGNVVSMFVRNKRSSQNGLNGVNGFSIFGTSGPKRVGDIKRPMVYGLQLITLFCVLFSFASIVEAKAQEPREGGATGQTAIKPLEIGDTIPEELWHLPLQVVNHPEGKETITLNDYRGKKLIILDFWATWCGSCITGMEKLSALQEDLIDELAFLPVSYEAKEKIQEIFIKNNILKKIKQVSIVDDETLAMYFPHRIIPHLIWLSTSGEIRAITGSDHVNMNNLKTAIRGDNLIAVSKSDILSFSQDKPLFLTDKYGVLDKLITQSVFCRFIPGVASIVGQIKDDELTRYYGINSSFLTLYSLAFPQLPHYKAARLDCSKDFRKRHLDTFMQVGNQYFEDKPLFTYELIIRSDYDSLHAERIKQDLDFNFQVRTAFTKKIKKCFVIVDRNKISKAAATQLLPMSKFRSKLEHQMRIPVLDESSAMGVPIEVYENIPSDLKTLNQKLLPHGLELREDLKEIEVFYIEEVS